MNALIEISLDKAAFADAPHQELHFILRPLASNVAGGAGERQLYVPWSTSSQRGRR